MIIRSSVSELLLPHIVHHLINLGSSCKNLCVGKRSELGNSSGSQVARLGNASNTQCAPQLRSGAHCVSMPYHNMAHRGCAVVVAAIVAPSCSYLRCVMCVVGCTPAKPRLHGRLNDTRGATCGNFIYRGLETSDTVVSLFTPFTLHFTHFCREPRQI